MAAQEHSEPFWRVWKDLQRTEGKKKEALTNKATERKNGGRALLIHLARYQVSCFTYICLPSINLMHEVDFFFHKLKLSTVGHNKFPYAPRASSWEGQRSSWCGLDSNAMPPEDRSSDLVSVTKVFPGRERAVSPDL